MTTAETTTPPEATPPLQVCNHRGPATRYVGGPCCTLPTGHAGNHQMLDVQWSAVSPEERTRLEEQLRAAGINAPGAQFYAAHAAILPPK